MIKQMNVIEIAKDNYLFAIDKDSPGKSAFVFRKAQGELRFLYRVKLVSNNHLQEQLEYIVKQFFDNKDKLDYEGQSKAEIFNKTRKDAVLV